MLPFSACFTIHRQTDLTCTSWYTGQFPRLLRPCWVRCRSTKGFERNGVSLNKSITRTSSQGIPPQNAALFRGGQKINREASFEDLFGQSVCWSGTRIRRTAASRRRKPADLALGAIPGYCMQLDTVHIDNSTSESILTACYCCQGMRRQPHTRSVGCGDFERCGCM